GASGPGGGSGDRAAAGDARGRGRPLQSVPVPPFPRVGGDAAQGPDGRAAAGKDRAAHGDRSGLPLLRGAVPARARRNPCRLLRHDAPLAASGKAQRRPLDLLKVLISYGGEQVSESRITDALWPRIDGDSAHRSFTSALHRLRKLLGEDRAVLLHEGRLTLDRRYFWVDAWAFEGLAAELERAADPVQAEKLAERMLALYCGPFMADDADASWYLQPRERMRGRLARAMGRVLRQWVER